MKVEVTSYPRRHTARNIGIAAGAIATHKVAKNAIRGSKAIYAAKVRHQTSKGVKTFGGKIRRAKRAWALMNGPSMSERWNWRVGRQALKTAAKAAV